MLTVVRIAARAHGGAHAAELTALAERKGSVLGGFNWSLQHLQREVDDVQDGQAKIESILTPEATVTRSAAGVGQERTVAILGGDCAWLGQ